MTQALISIVFCLMFILSTYLITRNHYLGRFHSTIIKHDVEKSKAFMDGFDSGVEYEKELAMERNCGIKAQSTYPTK